MGYHWLNSQERQSGWDMCFKSEWSAFSSHIYSSLFWPWNCVWNRGDEKIKMATNLTICRNCISQSVLPFFISIFLNSNWEMTDENVLFMCCSQMSSNENKCPYTGSHIHLFLSNAKSSFVLEKKKKIKLQQIK